MFAMQEKVAEMASFMSAGGIAVKQEPNMLGTGYVQVKQEQNKYEQVKEEPIDLVSSSSDADFNEYGNEAEESRTRLPALKQPLPPIRAAPKAKFARSNITGVPPPPPVPRSRTKPTGRSALTLSYTQTQQRRDISVRNWHDGMKRQATPDRILTEIMESTADNLPQILANMRVTGFGVVKNYKRMAKKETFDLEHDTSDENQSSSEPSYTSVFEDENVPDLQQAYYHVTPGWNANGTSNSPKHDYLFEGVVINSRDYEFKTRMSKVEPDDRSGRGPRQAMAGKTKALAAYNERYKGQMEDIIKGMFVNERLSNGVDPANPDNWHLAQNIVWGGAGHQHPHCDQGKAGAFNTDQFFPFVCIHGFGLHQFVMWLLPAKRKREYGFPFRFPKFAMLFLRGGCVHAGAYSQLSRGHLEFWPKAAAGWTRTRNPYWATAESMLAWQAKKVVFWIPDLRTFPFAYPDIQRKTKMDSRQ
jgi:hypothetical protein